MDMHALLTDPKTWVTITFLLFVVGTFKKVKQLLFQILDERSRKIEAELKQAAALREEAEGVLALYKQKQAQYTKEAEEILRKAREDADRMAKHADQELKTMLDARVQAALEEIAQEEVRAINDVRAHIVDISLAAARMVVVQQTQSTPQHELLTLSLADLDRKLH